MQEEKKAATLGAVGMKTQGKTWEDQAQTLRSRFRAMILLRLNLSFGGERSFILSLSLLDSLRLVFYVVEH